FSNLLQKDKFVKLLSVIMAIILWLIMVLIISPTREQIVNDVPIELNLAGTVPAQYDLSVIEGEGQTADVKVKGMAYKIGNLSKYDFIAVPNLSKVIQPGEYQIRVDIVKVNSEDTDYDVISPPFTINVKFDYLIEKSFPIAASVENIKPEEGYIKEEAYVNPENIVLYGPKSEIENVSRCVAVNTDSETVTDTITVSGELLFYDENNNRLEFKHTTYDVEEEYEITVPINKMKTVPLIFDYVNVPQGIDVSKIKYEMSETTINIAGPSKTIDEINNVSLGEIDFRNIDTNYSVVLDVNMLAGILNMDNINSVTVDFSMNELSSNQFNISKSNIITKNVPIDYNITIETKSINNIKMVGLESDIELLKNNDLIAILDFNDKEIVDGAFRFPVQIYSTGNKCVWAVGEYKVLVNASKKG
ncbi:MAG: CdaR family protein, partial [Oscillospiraceae bacterium]